MKPTWNRQARSVVFFLACGMLFIGTSCDSDSEKETRTPKTAEYDDIARGIAPLISAQLKANGILETSTNIVLGDGPTELHVDSTGNLEGSIGGLEWDVVADIQSSDRAELTALVNGDLALPTYNASLDVDSQWLFDGLQSTMITAKGTTVISADSEYDSLLTAASGMVQFDLAFDYDLQIPTEDIVALSGTANANVKVYFSATGLDGAELNEGRFDVKAQLSLDGSGNATLTLDGVAEYILDLEAGIVVRI